MYIKNGIAYAGEEAPILKICGVRPLANFVLWLRFNNGETKNFDCKPLFKYPVFKPLANKQLFDSVYIDCGTTVWDDGNIDIAPEYLYANGVESYA